MEEENQNPIFEHLTPMTDSEIESQEMSEVIEMMIHDNILAPDSTEEHSEPVSRKEFKTSTCVKKECDH